MRQPTDYTVADTTTFNAALDAIRDEPSNAGIELYLIAASIASAMRPGITADDLTAAAVERLQRHHSPT
jgi:hypothetical protein